MALLIQMTDPKTGAATGVGQILAINWRRDRSALIDVALYVSMDALNAGMTYANLQGVELTDGLLAELQTQMEPAIEQAVMTTPTFSTATQA